MTLDPTGKFAYVVNEGSDNVSAYSIGFNGDLTPVPGLFFAAGRHPVSVAITPLVPFALFFANLEIAKDRFEATETVTLGANCNGINPFTENVTLRIGTFFVMIPAGSFEHISFENDFFAGVINGVHWAVLIEGLGYHFFRVTAVGTNADVSRLRNPATVVLTIGINTGTTTTFPPSF